MYAYFSAQAPLMVGFFLLLIVAALKSGKREFLSFPIALAALAGTATLISIKLVPGDMLFGGALRITMVGKVFAFLSLVFAMLALILTEGYCEKIRVNSAEFRLLILAQALGFAHLPFANDLGTLFISFELISIPSYVMAGFNHHDARANEAGMKYLILGALGSCLFLLGLSFLYGATGEFRLDAIAAKAQALGTPNAPGSDLLLLKFSLVFFLGSLFFKLGVAPFHFWLPDIYQGSNLASLSFIASPAKVVLFGLLGSLLWGVFASQHAVWKPILLWAALASGIFGSFQALTQKNIKRLLAFSSTLNAGFILIAIALGALNALTLYLAAYGLATLGAIAALMAFGTQHTDVDEISDLQGVGKSSPWFAAMFTGILFSFAGIPLTAGFAAKFSIILEAFRNEEWLGSGGLLTLTALVVLGLVAFAFYFKLIRAMWLPAPANSNSNENSIGTRELKMGQAVFLFFCLAALIALGLIMRLPGAAG